MKLLLLFNYLSNGGNYFILASIQKTHYYILNISIGEIWSYRFTILTERWYNSIMI